MLFDYTSAKKKKAISKIFVNGSKLSNGSEHKKSCPNQIIHIRKNACYIGKNITLYYSVINNLWSEFEENKLYKLEP
jgi:hypothetical protein